MNQKNRPKISVYCGISLDGYIARENGELDYLDKFAPPLGDPEDWGFKKFIESIDALVMGSNTYRKVMSFNIPWPYEGKRVIVLSHSLTSVCNQAELFKGDIIQIVEQLQTQGIQHIYIDGANVIKQCLNARLVDELILTIVPVIIGSGIPLFSKLEQEISCQLIHSQTYASGIVQLTYNTEKI